MRLSSFLDKARAALLDSGQNRGGSTALRIYDGLDPQDKGLPSDIFIVCLVKALPRNTHDLSGRQADSYGLGLFRKRGWVTGLFLPDVIWATHRGAPWGAGQSYREND